MLLYSDDEISNIKNKAYNQGIEAAAELIIKLGTNNVGMVHDINRSEAEAIRKLKK